MKNTAEFFKYLDLFGTRFTFYTDNSKKYYTTFGGILTIISILLCIIAFSLLSFEDFKRNTPATLLTSNIPQNSSLISLEKEKIWIPWRIVDFEGNYINHTGKIYPVINYNYAKRTNKNESFNFTKKEIDYILCNETMKNISSEYNIEVNLETLYCFNMKNLEIGGDRNELFFNYIEINLYLCEKSDKTTCNNSKNGINSMEIEIYYPEIYFMSDNRKNPFSIIYKPIIYSLNNNNNVNILYLRKTTLLDDKGLFQKSIKHYSYWGGDFKIDKRTHITNNENSKIFSFKILINNCLLKYDRSYKKIHIIIFEFLPLIYSLYAIFRLITKAIKKSEENKKLIELLFENLIVKKDKLQEYVQKHFKNNNNNNKLINNNVKNINIKHNNQISTNLSHLQQKQLNQFSANFKKEPFLNSRNNNNNNNNANIIFSQRKDSIPCSPKLCIADKKSNLISLNDFSNSVFSNSVVNQENININNISNNNNSNNAINTFSFLNNINIESKIKFTRTSFLLGSGSQNQENISQLPNTNNLIHSKLFPFRYYFFLIFFKNIDISKRKSCFPQKFIKANLFLRQLLDISSYLSLQKEFQVLKNRFLTKEEMDYIENNKKININNQSFYRNVNECIDHHNLHILGDNVEKNYVLK